MAPSHFRATTLGRGPEVDYLRPLGLRNVSTPRRTMSTGRRCPGALADVSKPLTVP